MLNNILDLSQRLIAIRTDPDNILELNRALDLVKQQLREFGIEEFEHNSYRSILVYNSEVRPTKFKVILNGHLDVIPGKNHQYKPLIKDGKLFGVGSMDMKSNLSSIIFAFKEMASKVNYPLGLQIVTDEEIGGFNGTKFQIEQGVRTDFVIASEPTNLNIVNKAKGIIQLEIQFLGQTAHGAYPWKGLNALELCNDFINKIKQKFPNPNQEKWCSTINIAKIETSNDSFNKIPDDCNLKIEFRCTTEESKQIIPTVESLIPKNSVLKIVTNENALYTAEDNKYIEQIQASTLAVSGCKSITYGANGTSDSRHYTDVGSCGVEFGPIGGGIGEDLEWVNIKSLETYYHIICHFLKKVENL